MFKNKQFKSLFCMFMALFMIFTTVDAGILGMKHVLASASTEETQLDTNENITNKSLEKDEIVTNKDEKNINKDEKTTDKIDAKDTSKSKIKVRVRVEGPEYTILPETEVEVEKGAGNKEVLEAAGLKVEEMAGMIESIEDIKANGWWSVEPYLPNVSNGDNILFNGNGAMGSNSILEGASTVNAGEDFEVVYKEKDGKGIKNGEIKYYRANEYNYKGINKGKVKPIGTSIKTDEQGKAKIKLESGKYFITAEAKNKARAKALEVDVKEKVVDKIKVRVRVEGPEYTILPETEVEVEKGAGNKEVLEAAGLKVEEMAGMIESIEDIKANGWWSVEPYLPNVSNGDNILFNGNGAMGSNSILEGASTVNAGEDFEVVYKEKDGKGIKNGEIKYYRANEYNYKGINKGKVKPIGTSIKTDEQGKAKIKLESGKYFITAEAKNKARAKALEIEVKGKASIEIKSTLRIETEKGTDFLDELEISEEGQHLEDILKNKKGKIYKPKFDKEGRLLQLHENKYLKGKPYFSVIINGKIVEKPRDIVIKPGDSIILSYNGAINQLQVEVPKECESGKTFEVVVKDEYGKRIKDSKVFLEYFKPWNGAWAKKENSTVDENGKVNFAPDIEGKYRIFAEKDGYIRSIAKFTEVILPKIEGGFPKEVKSNEDFETTITATGKPQSGVKVYWVFKEDSRKRNKVEIGKTDEKGKVIGKIDAPAGQYTLIVDFHGNIVELGDINILDASEYKSSKIGDMNTALRKTTGIYKNGKVYLFGGEGSEWSPVNTILCFDPETNGIKSGGNLPDAFVGNNAVIDDNIYLFGNGKVYKYNIDDSKITEIADLPQGYQLKSIGTAVINKKVYIYERMDTTGAIVEFDPITEKVQIVSSIKLPYGNSYSGPTDGSMIVQENKKMYIIGGSSKKIYEFDPASKHIKSTELEYVIENGSTTTINNKVYIFGGYTAPEVSKNGELNYRILELDIKNKTLQPVGYLPKPIESSCAVLVDNEVYVFGGNRDNKVQSDILKVLGFSINDTQKPEIIVKGIKDNTVLSTKEVEFTVNVTDNVDENIIPEVKFNDNVISEKDGKYNVILENGNNNIEIIARDKAGNIEKKKYTLIYKSDVMVNKIVIEGSKERLHPKDKITLKTKAVDEQNNVIPGKEFIFSSSDEKIATVDSKTGEVTAIGNGTVILTVALKDDNSIKENVKITITDKYEVYMRIEGYDHTILPRTKLEVGLFDLSEHLGKASGSSATQSNGWDVSKFEKPTNAHAIVKALVDAGFRQKKLGDTDESKLFDFQDYGWSLYIAMIDGDREFDHDGMSGWLYRVNDDLLPIGCNDAPLNDGDEIVWMYSPYGFDNIYTKIFADETNVSVNDEVQINLIGYTGGYEKVEEKVDGATILVNGKSYIKDGKDVITDLKGNAVISFKEPGRYTISANRLDSKGLIDIIRPNPIIINVSDKKDTQKPKISLKGIMNGETINKSEITFTVTAEDPQDGKLTPIIKCNDKVINGKNDNYKVSLKEGKNIIFIQAKDKGNNIVEKTIEVICDTKDRTLPEIKVEGIESGITNAQETIFTVKASDEKDGRLNPVVKLNEKEIQDENGKYKVLLQEGLNTITIEAVNKVGNKATEIFKITYKKDTELPKNKDELRKKILEILPETVEYSTKENYSNDWVTAGLGRLKDYKNRISPNYLEDTKKVVKELVAEQDKGSRTFKVTDFQRITMGILGAGGNPTNIDGINIIERIYNPRKTDKGQDYIDRQGLNAVIWGLIAVDSKNYKIPKGSKWNRDKFIKEILDNECHNNEHPILKGKRGGWQYGGNKTIDPDMTGMAMIALAPYYETRKDVKLAVDRAVENLSLIQRQDGGYASWGTVNSESCVQVIMGLCANNFDPMGGKFTKKDGSVVDALLRFKLESTGFAHAEDPQDDNKLKPNGMANEQALYGLAQLMYWLDGNKGSIFKWEDDKIEEPNQPQKSEKFIAKRIGKEKLKKNSNAEVKFHIENISKENEEVTLAVVLYDKNTNEMVNYSYVRKTLKAGEKEKFAGGFTIPQKGDYVVKAIICDSLNTDKMNVLTEPVEIAVE
ncbi:hypothetical protein DP124_08600 [Clostridium tetani]|uniref:DUF4430 domain-containing protein n=2 Tax=Clostridium tetani TaxID=1513 RepID=UPI00100C1C4B|nr:DUF4430 domain-containing protein [Clostridium tetani]RXI52254.1 hypothetical protein DP124_08600 [Clostridium tetani]